MKIKNNRLELAILVSILLHFLLIGLLLLGSLFTKIEPSSGGNGGDSETIDAVMVDTGQVAAEYDRLKAEKQAIEPDEPAKEEQKEEQEK